MKRKIGVMAVLAFALVLPSCGKKAPPIRLPGPEQVLSVQVAQGENWKEYSDAGWISDFLSSMAEAEPTAIQSVNDRPNVEGCIQVNFCFSIGTSTLFLYEKQGKYYAEQPYQGIYLVDPALLEQIGMKESGE